MYIFKDAVVVVVVVVFSSFVHLLKMLFLSAIIFFHFLNIFYIYNFCILILVLKTISIHILVIVACSSFYKF